MTLRIWVWLVVPFLATGCENALNCQIFGDNVRGRITFAPGIAVRSGVPLRVEWSKDSFATPQRGSGDVNDQGLLWVPYSLCADDGADLQFRAYQDFDGDGQLDAGEPSGRYDLTADGNAVYITKTLPNSTDSKWETLNGIDIAVDTP